MNYPMRIGGQEVTSSTPIPVLLPYDGTDVGTVYQATPEQVNAALDAAVRAAKLMRDMTRDERSAILRRAHYRLHERKDELARAVCNETGKPIKEANIEVDRAGQTLLFSSEEAHRLAGEVVPLDAHPAGKGRWGMTIREPLGVIAAITPFNFPLNLALHKIGPALAGGNAVVHKPASTTPLSAIILAGIFEECGLPAGALNVLTGPGSAIGQQLVTDPRVAMVTFTGSAEVGLRLRSIAGLKRVTLELGNNSAVIIEDDADLDTAARRCAVGAFSHSGQVCISVQRVFVNAAVREPFLERLTAATQALRIGHPQDPSTDISSLITEHEAERVDQWVQEAVGAGARLVSGGERRRATITPAILTDVPAHTQLACREAFGPVVYVNAYNTLDEAIALVNDSDYGLQAGIYTRDLQKAFRAAREVHVGGFMINEVAQFRVDQMPYGGVKMSGTGREGPKYAIEEMTEQKLITWPA